MSIFKASASDVFISIYVYRLWQNDRNVPVNPDHVHMIAVQYVPYLWKKNLFPIVAISSRLLPSNLILAHFYTVSFNTEESKKGIKICVNYTPIIIYRYSIIAFSMYAFFFPRRYLLGLWYDRHYCQFWFCPVNTIILYNSLWNSILFTVDVSPSLTYLYMYTLSGLMSSLSTYCIHSAICIFNITTTLA